MALSGEDFASIAKFVELEVGRLVGRRRDIILIAIVTKIDIKNRLVWVADLGDQPIPMVAHILQIVYFDESPRGTSGGGSFKVYRKDGITAGVYIPRKGDRVLIVRDMQYDGHPYCLGTIHSTEYIQDLEDD